MAVTIDRAELVVRLERLLATRRMVGAASGPLRVMTIDREGVVGSKNPVRNWQQTQFGVLFAEALDRFELAPLALADAPVPSPNNFELAISRKLAIPAEWFGPDVQLSAPVATPPGRLALLDEAADHALETRYRRETIETSDGALLQVYSCGRPTAPPLLLVNPCGMPFDLARQWFDRAEPEYFAFTWESRGMFADQPDFDTLGQGLDAQVADLFAVMDHFNVRQAPVVALCVGVTIALRAALVCPERVRGLVLGNGFYALQDCERTETESGLHRTMATVSRSRALAGRMFEMFSDPRYMSELDAEAHLTLYPYCSAENLYRYGRLSQPLLSADKRGWLESIRSPAFVAVGLQDTVVSPSGSMTAARLLPNSCLHREPDLDHLSVFDARPAYSEPAFKFLSEHT